MMINYEAESLLPGASVLITGGTGSFGQRFAATVLQRHRPGRLSIYSRDELKQFDMQQAEPFSSHPREMRWFVGDVRDEQRLREAMQGVDVVIHAAALKQVPAAELHPFEAVKTNVLGTQNVIGAAIAAGVGRLVALSTDKAAAPLNAYGATKLISDKLCVAANEQEHNAGTRVSVVRYGNVLGSRGSVIPLFLSRRASGVIPITDKRMTRFTITLQEAVEFVIATLGRMRGGEIFVPKIPSYRITDLAEAIAPKAHLEMVGLRPGEKLHEQMIAPADAPLTVEFSDHYVILPAHRQCNMDDVVASYPGEPGKVCVEGFTFDSENSDHLLTVQQLRDLIGREVQ
jgi:UDP-N-acetylglucosamine 4,6-dehydratase (inverting)